MLTQSCEHCLSCHSKNWRCSNYSNCPYFPNNYNMIINKFKDNFVEVLVYKREFNIIGNPNITDVDRKRKFCYDQNGDLIPLTDEASLADLSDTLCSSRKRSLDHLYGYALSNSWNYFFTLTIDPKEIDRTVRDIVVYCWQLFRQKMQYIYPDVKILAVLENHENGGIHFHGFFGNCDLSQYLVRAIDCKQYLYSWSYEKQCKEFKLDKNGNKILNKHFLKAMTEEYTSEDRVKHVLPIWTFKEDFFPFGFTTLVKLEDGTNPLHITAYISKYMSKDISSCVAYNKKAYFVTRNCNYKEKKVLTVSSDKVANYTKGFNLVKENENFACYRLPVKDLPKAYGLTEDLTIDSSIVFAKEITQLNIDDVF